MTLTDEQMCAECGMACPPNEYHPYAACLMFKGCHDSETVRSNLYALSAQPAKPAITEERVIELARQAGALKASDIYDKESLIVDAGDLIRFAALLAAEGNKP